MILSIAKLLREEIILKSELFLNFFNLFYIIFEFILFLTMSLKSIVLVTLTVSMNIGIYVLMFIVMKFVIYNLYIIMRGIWIEGSE